MKIMEELNWSEMKAKLENSVKIQQIEEELKIIVSIDTKKIKENGLITGLLKNKEQLKRTIGEYKNDGTPINCEIEIKKKEGKIILYFKEESEYDKSLEFLKEFFHGDILKTMLEAMFGAFGNHFRNDNPIL
jgi:hypothetical protein